MGDVRKIELTDVKGVSVLGNPKPPSLDEPINFNINNQSTSTNKPKKEESSLEPERTLQQTPFVATEYPIYSGNNLNDHNDFIVDNDFSIPQWGYDNFILERTNFQKSITSLFNEPAFFYFKLFFKFDTRFGLLGPSGWDKFSNSVYEPISLPESYNTALSYLGNLIKYMHLYYGNSELEKRYEALNKFINILSYINTEAPWFFKSIKGLDKVETPLDLKDDDNIIEIACMQEAIDMRLETLLGLYRYACFDNYHNREIIPENLRMFDMAIMVFQTPLRYYHTGMMSRSTNKNFEYKKIHSQNESGNRMSYKIILFKNCEILPDTFKTLIPGELNNERPTMMENISIKIKYQRALVYNYNEFYNLFYGDVTGPTTEHNYDLNPGNLNDLQRFNAIKKNIANLYYYNPYSTKYKDLIDASEAVMTDGMRMVLPEFCMGNLYGTKFGINSDYFEDKLKALKSGSIRSGNLYGDATDVNSEYSKAKLKRLKSKSVLGNLYGDTTNVKGDYYKYKQKELKKKSLQGNLYGTGTNIEKKYFLSKLKELKKKSLQGNLYGDTTSPTGSYYEAKLKFFKKPSKEGNVKIQDTYGKDSNINFLDTLSNDYTNLIESDDLKYVADVNTELLKEATKKAHITNNMSIKPEPDLKSLIKEKGLSIDEKKVTFWQEVKNQFWSGNDSITDAIKNFDLRGLIKF